MSRSAEYVINYRWKELEGSPRVITSPTKDSSLIVTSFTAFLHDPHEIPIFKKSRDSMTTASIPSKSPLTKLHDVLISGNNDEGNNITLSHEEKTSKFFNDDLKNRTTDARLIKADSIGRTVDQKHPLVRSKPKHVAAIEGHPTYHWDQESILRAVFEKLSNNSGILRDRDITNISSSPKVLELLKCTVFSSYVKKKYWDVFLGIFVDKSELSLSEWIEAAKTLSEERGVLAKHIRTDEEHRMIHEYDQMSILLSDAQFASAAREHVNEITRSYGLQRSIKTGDVVWALHGRGVVWFPAVVVDIVWSSYGGAATYDLWYPFTEHELSQARSKSIARHLVSSSNQTELISNTNIEVAEDTLYERLFDHIGGRPGTESTSLSNLVAEIENAELSRYYFALSALAQNLEESDFSIPALKAFFIEFFANGREVGDFDDVIIKKDEFTEFCKVILDMGRYRACIGNKITSDDFSLKLGQLN